MANIFNDILDSLKKFGQDQDKKAKQNQQKQIQQAQQSFSQAAKKNAVATVQTPKQQAQTDLNKAVSTLQSAQTGQTKQQSAQKALSDIMNTLGFANKSDVASGKVKTDLAVSSMNKVKSGLVNAADKVMNDPVINNVVRTAINTAMPGSMDLARDTTGAALNLANSIGNSYQKKTQAITDDRFNKLVDTSAVQNKVKNDANYMNSLMDESGNLVDYSAEKEVLKQQYSDPAAKQRLNQIEEIEKDQRALMYSLQYDDILKDPNLTDDMLEQFKNSVITDELNKSQGIGEQIARRTSDTIGSTLKSWAGNKLEAAEAMLTAVNKFAGGDYDMNADTSIGDALIENAEMNLMNAKQGASGLESLIQDTYSGTAPFLYDLVLIGTLNGGITEDSMGKTLLSNDLTVFGGAIKQNMDQGYDFETSFLNASAHALAEHMIESIGGEVIVEACAGKLGTEMLNKTFAYGMNYLLRASAAEFSEEVIGGLVDPLIDSATLGKDMTLREYIDQTLFNKDMWYGAAIGALGGAFMGGGAGFITSAQYQQYSNQLYDTYKIDTKLDRNQAIEFRNAYEELLRDNPSADNTLVLRANIDALNRRIADYERANPYSDAFTTPGDNDVIDVSLRSDNETIAKASQIDVVNDMQRIVDTKNEYLAAEENESVAREIEAQNEVSELADIAQNTEDMQNITQEIENTIPEDTEILSKETVQPEEKAETVPQMEDKWQQSTQNVLNEANNFTGDEQLTVEDISDIVHQRKVNPRVIEAMQRAESVFRESVPEWVPGYDTLRAEYPDFSEETFNDAVYQILSYGEMNQETRFKLHQNLMSEFDFVSPENVNAVNDEINGILNDFVNEAIETFSNETKYKAGETDTATAKKAITVNEAYGGQDIEGEFNKRQYGTWLNELSSRNKQELQAKYQPLTDTLINNDRTIAETKGKKSDHGISHLKTFDQNLKSLANGNVEVYNALREQLRYNLLDKAAATIYEVKNNAQTEIIDKVKELGITQGSKEDIALQYILEGHTEEWIGDEPGNKNGFKAYTEEDLRKNFDKKTYENILKAKNIIKESYDNLYELITATQLTANGDVEGNAEVEIAEAKTKVEQAWNTLTNIRDEIAKNGSKESTQAAYEIQKKKYNTLVTHYNSLVEKHSSGDLTRRQLTPYREDYSHHIQKRSLRNSLKNIKNADLQVPTELAGISDFTNPNTAFSTISMAQDGKVYDPTALGSYAAYVNEASQLIGYNPVILELRQFNKDIKETAQGKTLNKFSEYLNDYANMLAGKRNAVDRGIQKIVGDKTMKVVQTLNNYAKGAALAMNIRSALVQFANIPNGLGILEQRGGAGYVGDVAKGMRDFTASINKDNTAIDQSAFLSNRFFDFDTGEKGFSKKFNDVSGWTLQIGDKIGAQVIWWSAYEQANRLGEANPVLYADDVTRSAVAGRTKEDLSLAAQSQVLNLLFPFQVESINLYQTLKDQVQNHQMGAIITYNMAAFVLNAMIKGITNGDDEILPEFITPIYEELRKALEGETEGKDVAQNILLGEVAEFISLLPAGSTVTQLIFGDDSETVFGDYNPNRYGLTNLGLSGFGNLVTDLVKHKDDIRQQAIDVIENLTESYVKGGKQLMRTTKGIQSMGGLPEYKNGEFQTSPINYTQSGKVAYVNDQDNIMDWIRAGLFGKWSTSEARKYIDSGFKSMSTSAGNVFEMLQQAGGNAFDNFTEAKEYQDNKKAAKEGEDTDSLREQLIANGTYNDYMKQVTKAYEDYLTGFDYSGEDEPKSFTQFANSYGITADDLKQDTYQNFYDTYSLDKETQEVFSKALDIQNVENALGKTISNSGATLRRVQYEEAGIYDEILEYIEKNNLEYSDFGLTKTTVGYNSTQVSNMLAKINAATGENYSYNGKTPAGSGGSKSKKRSSKKSKSSGGLTKTQKRAMIKALSAYGGSSSSNVFSALNNILSSATSIEDAKKKVKAIQKKYT